MTAPALRVRLLHRDGVCYLRGEDVSANLRRHADIAETVAETDAERATMGIAADLMRGHADQLDLILIGYVREGVS